MLLLGRKLLLRLPPLRVSGGGAAALVGATAETMLEVPHLAGRSALHPAEPRQIPCKRDKRDRTSTGVPALSSRDRTVGLRLRSFHSRQSIL